MDALQYLFSPTLSIAFNQPVFWLMVGFAVVASIYTMTQRNNVGWNSTGTVHSFIIALRGSNA